MDVWSLELDVAAPRFDSLYAGLSGEERSRAVRFHFSRDRHRWIVARGTLREILAKYLQCPRAEIAFRSGKGGKPALDPAQHRSEWSFNLSHSGGRALVAVTSGLAAGIDIERIRDISHLQAIARLVLTPAERAALDRCNSEDARSLFFTAWTRKEACVKVSGAGCSHPLDRVEVLCSFRTPQIVELGHGSECWLTDVPAEPGYVAALALSSPPTVVRVRKWSRAVTLP